ncbi:hypothetical protein P4B35_08785 [Pontiellaceae bacterium B12227]|nr:hypothetical protein [Pontiellaceae bacterium B12227]
MPNWVGNTLYVTGHEKARRAFRRQACGTYTDAKGKVRKSDFMFARFFPPPPEDILKGLYVLEKDGWPVDMKWQADNWGCKWDVHDCSKLIRVTKSSLVYGFSTAWSPPWEFFRRLSKQYPYLHFSLHSYMPPEGTRCITKYCGGDWNLSSDYKDNLHNVGKLPGLPDG